MPSHDAQAAGLAFGLDKGAQRGAQRSRRQRRGDHHHGQRQGWLPQFNFITKMPKPTNSSHLHQGGQHLSEDGAEQVGAFAGGGGQQAAQGAFLAFVGEHFRDGRSAG